MGNIIGSIFLGVISIACFVFSYLQFNEKGFLFNNAYIYAIASSVVIERRKK